MVTSNLNRVSGFILFFFFSPVPWAQTHKRNSRFIKSQLIMYKLWTMKKHTHVPASLFLGNPNCNYSWFCPWNLLKNIICFTSLSCRLVRRTAPHFHYPGERRKFTYVGCIPELLRPLLNNRPLQRKTIYGPFREEHGLYFMATRKLGYSTSLCSSVDGYLRDKL